MKMPLVAISHHPGNLHGTLAGQRCMVCVKQRCCGFQHQLSHMYFIFIEPCRTALRTGLGVVRCKAGCVQQPPIVTALFRLSAP